MENIGIWNHPDNYFFKMHGTGNDFIIINEKLQNGQDLSRQDAKRLGQKLCHRKFGIGADGLLIIRRIQDVYKMQVINSDGSQPNMCGNGLRCFVSLLYNQKLIPSNYKVLTDNGQKDVLVQPLDCEVVNEIKKYLVTLKIGKGGLIEEFNDQKFGTIYRTTIGVPHIVIFLNQEQLQKINFQEQGRQIQKDFDANINFCKISEVDKIIVKTYQRGAGMTYSCGTGVSSSVYIAVQKLKMHKKVKAQTDGGDIIIQVTNQNEIIMKGPAQIICEGKHNF